MRTRKRSLGLLLLLLGLIFPLSSLGEALWPEQSGTQVLSDSELRVDASHSDQGYVMAYVANPTQKKLKLRVVQGKTTLDYDLPGDGEAIVVPLQLGSGGYEMSLYINVSGKKYSSGGKVSLDAQISPENVVFLYPNQYVDYNRYTEAVQKAEELGAGLSGDQAIYQAVCGFIEGEFSYDFVRAKKIKAATLPEIDECYEKRMGICQDLSAVMVCMLRVQGVPAKLMIGYADKYYHAWTTAVINGEEVFYDPTAAIGALKAKKYKVERYY